MMKTNCPRCEGPIPNEAHHGQYPGALSRTDNETEICSSCGHDEAWEQMAGVLRPREKWDAWLQWQQLYIDNNSELQDWVTDLKIKEMKEEPPDGEDEG